MNGHDAPPSPAPIQVLLLGTYHFANPGRDLVKQSVENHLSEAKQTEILDVVRRLVHFAPTAVLVERAAASQARLTEAYRRFCSGDHPLSADEAEQLGFRLATHFGHETVHAIDEEADILLGEFMLDAQQRAPEFLESLQAEIARDSKRMNALLASSTVREVLLSLNAPFAIREVE